MSNFTAFNNGTASGQVLMESAENQQFLYSIYNAFENTKSLTQKDILKKCAVSLIGQNNFANKDTLIVQCIDLINILNNHLSLFVQNGHIKFNSNKYSINEEHQDFKNFKINNLKFLTITAHSIEYITKLNLMIDDIAFGFSISSSDNNEEISETNDNNNMEEENNNLDALEESDDEDEFENNKEDRFVYLEKECMFNCVFNYKFKKWIPKSTFQKSGAKTSNF